MQGFVDSFLTTLGAYLPSVLGALLIFVVGWLFAVAVKKCVAGILGRIGLDDRISDKSHEPLQVEKLLTGLVYYLILLFVLLLDPRGLGRERRSGSGHEPVRRLFGGTAQPCGRDTDRGGGFCAGQNSRQLSTDCGQGPG